MRRNGRSSRPLVFLFSYFIVAIAIAIAAAVAIDSLFRVILLDLWLVETLNLLGYFLSSLADADADDAADQRSAQHYSTSTLLPALPD